jgi:hypothetical protein
MKDGKNSWQRRKKMRRYGITMRLTGTQYIEVDVPNGEDPEEYASDLIDATKVDEWEAEVQDIDEVDPNE